MCPGKASKLQGGGVAKKIDESDELTGLAVKLAGSMPASTPGPVLVDVGARFYFDCACLVIGIKEFGTYLGVRRSFNPRCALFRHAESLMTTS